MFLVLGVVALALGLVLVVPGPAGAIDGIALSKGKKGAWSLVMPSELSQSMRDSVPGFEVAAQDEYVESLRRKYPFAMHQAPFALIADLNGDAREDLVVDGRQDGDRVVYVAISDEHTYRWFLAVREPRAGTAPRKTALRWANESTRFGLAGKSGPSLDTVYYNWSKERDAVVKYDLFMGGTPR